jgi:hypothetical protein
MSRTSSTVITTVLVLALSACSDDGKEKPHYDLGWPDVGQQQDGGVTEAGSDAASDAVSEAGDDGPTPDTKPAPDQTVSADAPVGPCNPALDLKPLALDPAYCVVYRFTLAAVPDAINVDNDKLLTYTLDKSVTPFKGTVELQMINATTGKPGAASAYLSFTAATTDPASKVFATKFLPLSAAGFTAVSYTDSTFKGELVWGDKGIKTPKIVAKSGAYDAVFLDNKTILLNGSGIGTLAGQGVYVVQDGVAPWLLIKDLGVASGHMALGQTVLFAGGAFGTTYENQIYGFTLTEIKAAVTAKTTLSATADGDLVYKAGFIPDATALGDSLLAGDMDATYAFKTVERIPVSVVGSKVTPAAAKTVITPAGGGNVAQLAGSQGKRLGLLLSGTGKTEVVVVEEK